jgi:hypothetical protein
MFTGSHVPGQCILKHIKTDPFVPLYVYIDLRPTEQIVVRFNIGESHDKLSCDFSFT